MDFSAVNLWLKAKTPQIWRRLSLENAFLKGRIRKSAPQAMSASQDIVVLALDLMAQENAEPCRWPKLEIGVRLRTNVVPTQPALKNDARQK